MVAAQAHQNGSRKSARRPSRANRDQKIFRSIGQSYGKLVIQNIQVRMKTDRNFNSSQKLVKRIVPLGSEYHFIAGVWQILPARERPTVESNLPFGKRRCWHLIRYAGWCQQRALI